MHTYQAATAGRQGHTPFSTTPPTTPPPPQRARNGSMATLGYPSSIRPRAPRPRNDLRPAPVHSGY
eukprot:scaffold4889_cov108-Isochrysis_galbana.AAC.4